MAADREPLPSDRFERSAKRFNQGQVLTLIVEFL